MNQAPTFYQDQFNKHTSMKVVFSQEASMLGLKPGILPFGRLPTDAGDDGLILVNRINNSRTMWTLSQVDQQDGDVMGWKFSPTHETVVDNPHLEGFKILIIND